MTEKGMEELRAKRSKIYHQRGIADIGQDILLHIFSYLGPRDLARVHSVCKSWYNIIQKSSSWRYLYFVASLKDIGHMKNIQNEVAPKDWLTQLARYQHGNALRNGPVQIHAWKAHSKRINCCRAGIESIITGVGDETVRIWSLSSYQCLEEYATLDKVHLLDLDFDESKVVGLVDRGICLWKRRTNRNAVYPCCGSLEHASCLCYTDPEVVIGCGDGTIRIFDLYSNKFSRMFRQNFGAITCISMIDDRFLINGSSTGNVIIHDIMSGQKISSLKHSTTFAGVTCIWANNNSCQVYAGTTSGHIYGWDTRTYKQLWGIRISSNVIYSMSSHSLDPSILAVGGIDGVLRILDSQSGDVISAYVPMAKMGNIAEGMIAKCKATRTFCSLDKLPRSIRRPITSIAMGMSKIITTHNDSSIMIWRFHENDSV